MSSGFCSLGSWTLGCPAGRLQAFRLIIALVTDAFSARAKSDVNT